MSRGEIGNADEKPPVFITLESRGVCKRKLRVSSQVTGLDLQVPAHCLKESCAEFFLGILQRSGCRVQPDPTMATFTETGLVLKANPTAAREAL